MERQKEDIEFSGVSTLPTEIFNLQTPLQFFNFFVTEELLDICNETHKYSIQLDVNKPFHLTKTELKKFLGICVMMSLIHVPNCRNYWNEVLGNRTIIETMPVNQFESIKKYLHFNDNDTAVSFNDFRHDRLHKLRPFLDSINERFALVPLEESLVIDEQMCATKASHFLKQFMPAKPHRWGYKLFILAGVSGFPNKVEAYTGL